VSGIEPQSYAKETRDFQQMLLDEIAYKCVSVMVLRSYQSGLYLLAARNKNVGSRTKDMCADALDQK
jgi:hypothetical protein